MSGELVPRITIPGTEVGPLESHLPADRTPALAYLAGLAPGSRPAMRGALEVVARTVTPGVPADCFPWWHLRPQHAAAVRALVAERYAPATANKILAALRGVLRACWRLGYLDGDTLSRLLDVKGVRGFRVPPGRSLTSGELRALSAGCRASRNTARGLRDVALLATLYSAGLRVSEAVTLALADYSDGLLKVLGKGNKERLVPIENGGRSALEAWLALRGAAPGPLFVRVAKGGKLTAEPLTPRAVRKACVYQAKASGVPRFSPHDARRSFVSDLLDAGVDIATVASLAGHASVTTTQRYDRRGEAAKSRAAKALHFPF